MQSWARDEKSISWGLIPLEGTGPGAAGTWGGDASLERAGNHGGRLLGTQSFLVAPQDQLSHRGVVQGLLLAGEFLEGLPGLDSEPCPPA